MCRKGRYLHFRSGYHDWNIFLVIWARQRELSSRYPNDSFLFSWDFITSTLKRRLHTTSVHSFPQQRTSQPPSIPEEETVLESPNRASTTSIQSMQTAPECQSRHQTCNCRSLSLPASESDRVFQSWHPLLQQTLLFPLV